MMPAVTGLHDASTDLRQIHAARDRKSVIMRLAIESHANIGR